MAWRAFTAEPRGERERTLGQADEFDSIGHSIGGRVRRKCVGHALGHVRKDPVHQRERERVGALARLGCTEA